MTPVSKKKSSTAYFIAKATEAHKQHDAELEFALNNPSQFNSRDEQDTAITTAKKRKRIAKLQMEQLNRILAQDEANNLEQDMPSAAPAEDPLPDTQQPVYNAIAA